MLSSKKLLLMKLGAAQIRPQDVMAVTTFVGNGGTQKLTNGLDFASKGGLAWFKRRDADAPHYLFDTVRGRDLTLCTNSPSGEGNGFADNVIGSFNSDGITVNSVYPQVNGAGQSEVFFAFLIAAGFLDIITYTGDGVAGRKLPHRLGMVPGLMAVKRLDTIASWNVYHRNTGAGGLLSFDSTAPYATSGSTWNNTAPTTTDFTVGNNGAINSPGARYVAFVFAHNPDLIHCNIVSHTNGTATPVNLAWTPQFVLTRMPFATDTWYLMDDKRTEAGSPFDRDLAAGSTRAEGNSNRIDPTATGFNFVAGNTTGQHLFMATRAPT